MKKVRFHFSSRGFASVEALLSVALVGMVAAAVLGGLVFAMTGTAASGQRLRAVALADEGLEAARAIRDASFASLADGTYGVSSASGVWAFSGASDTTGPFARAVDIATEDARTRRVTSTVTWNVSPARSGSVSLATMLTDWRSDRILGWALPTLVATVDMSGNQNGIRVAVSGSYAYVLRDQSELTVFDVSAPAFPAPLGTLSLPNGAANLAVSGAYVYVASANNGAELQIVDVSNPAAPAIIGTYNAPGNANANGIAVAGGVAFLVRNASSAAELVSVDVSNPASPAAFGFLELGGDGFEVVVVGSAAYVASALDAAELQVVNVSVPSVPALVASVDLSGVQNALTLAADAGAGIVVGRAGGGLDVLTIALPFAPAYAGSTALGDDVNDLALDGASSYAFAVTNNNAAEFAVVDVSVPSAPALVGTANASDDLRGVAYDAGTDRAYVVGVANDAEFIVYAPDE